MIIIVKFKTLNKYKFWFIYKTLINFIKNEYYYWTFPNSIDLLLKEICGDN